VHYNSDHARGDLDEHRSQLGDEPITASPSISNTGDLFVSTDFGVNMLTSGGSMWTPAPG